MWLAGLAFLQGKGVEPARRMRLNFEAPHPLRGVAFRIVPLDTNRGRRAGLVELARRIGRFEAGLDLAFLGIWDVQYCHHKYVTCGYEEIDQSRGEGFARSQVKGATGNQRKKARSIVGENSFSSLDSSSHPSYKILLLVLSLTTINQAHP